MWYILPVRIIEREATYYDSHFMLFTVYAHYDCLTKKLVLFYIHRTGSESARAASRSSDIVKDCLENDLKYVMARGDDGLTMLRSSPFAIQMPTIIAAVVFWTDALHKERIDMWAKEDKARKNLEEVDTVKFHDVARYAHSYKTNTEFTRRVIEFVIGQHDWFAAHIGGKTGYSPRSPLYTHMSERLKTQLWQMKMSERYSDEAVARSDVMLSLVNMFMP